MSRPLRIFRLTPILLTLVLCCGAQPVSADSDDPPRCIILMIADGLGYAHVAAGGMYRFGAAGTQCYEQWPVQLAMSTYPAGGGYDPQLMWSDPLWQRSSPTDSAAAATAMATGYKTDNGVISLDPGGQLLPTVVEAAASRGMRTGVVSTVPFCHATPAAFGAHVLTRSDYTEIARQMLHESPLDLIIGCGHPWYDNAGQRRSAPDYRYISESDWQAIQAPAASGWSFVEQLQQFEQLAQQGGNGRIIGIPRVWGTLQEERPARAERPYESPLNPNLPDLATLSLAALNTLDNDRGFFLMLEGGAVDWAAHDQDEVRLIEELQDFNQAVDVVSAWIEHGPGWDDCLLVVTGDHECGHLCRDGSDLLELLPESREAGELPGMVCSYGSHTNQLIPLYARGSGAELLLPLADETDPVRGAYLDNAELGQFLIRVTESR
ncbi:alkaline phosphatase [bacterium]|nr:alkaline phosphatase [bacterium]